MSIIPTSKNPYANLWNYNPSSRRAWVKALGIEHYVDRSYESLPKHVQRRFNLYGAKVHLTDNFSI